MKSNSSTQARGSRGGKKGQAEEEQRPASCAEEAPTRAEPRPQHPQQAAMDGRQAQLGGFGMVETKRRMHKVRQGTERDLSQDRRGG